MIEPARAAFLLIDMQNGFIDTTSPLCIAGAAATVPACAHTLAAADGSDVEAVLAGGGQGLSLIHI